MSNTFNNYLQILLYLKQFEGDGRMHSVEEQLVVEHNQKISILIELAREEYIVLHGGHHASSVSFGDGKTYGGGYISAEAKITFKGSKYLKEELQMIDNNRYNIHIGDNSTANLIMHSPGSTIHNKVQTQKKITKIIETLKEDKAIDITTRDNAILILNNLESEIEAGEPTRDTWNKVLAVGANIASVGSLVLALAQQFCK
jgi:hypothetical protein